VEIMFCRQCGSDLKENARFCPGCSAPTDPVFHDGPPLSQANDDRQDDHRADPGQPTAPAAPTPLAAPAPPAAPVRPLTGHQRLQPERKPAGRFPKKPVIVLAVFLAVILLVQQFIFPFLVQRGTFNKLSPLILRTVKPTVGREDIRAVSGAEAGRIQAYARGIGFIREAL
jgi:hypothetical protein